MTANSFIAAQAALFAWRAAADRGLAALLAVLQVLRNRVLASTAEGDSPDWLAVIASAYETLVSATHPGEPDPRSRFPDLREPNFQQLLALSESILEGQRPDPTSGALYWTSADHSGAVVGPSITVIGGLRFFK